MALGGPVFLAAPSIPAEVRMYIFGHSLINHDPPALPTTAGETSVPHWLDNLADEASLTYGMDGQYGFLQQHSVTPPSADWGITGVTSLWTAGAFADIDFDTILITAANFIQHLAPTDEYEGDNPDNETPHGETLKIIDYLQTEEPTARIYIYENWPEMAPYLGAGFPPTAGEFATYNAFTEAGFHDWWVTYHNGLVAARPTANIKMIPVGPIMAKLFTESPLDGLDPENDLYEDDAPHGQPPVYYLASLITYMAVFGVRPPLSYSPPASIPSLITDNYAALVDTIWAELEAFDFPNAQSRVW